MDGMDNLLMTYRDMTTRDWLVDAAVALAAFAVGCLQLMLTASSIIIPDLALRQYLGVVNVVPDLQVFVGLGMTVVPLVLRRRFPLARVLVAGVPVEGAGAPAGIVAAPSATAAGSGVSGAAAVGRSFDSAPSALCSG